MWHACVSGDLQQGSQAVDVGQRLFGGMRMSERQHSGVVVRLYGAQLRQRHQCGSTALRNRRSSAWRCSASSINCVIRLR
ncbi:hypothetical protein XBLMG947_3276 [Xanthomonas bromi]|uniref:Uncharacterized protein n=1 Tax=Xanthomonas bromi TaxID=56449 RepID=A0A1C3NPZ8_9XANT|nr:hypothetical protein XBLMG947_3276 [Xanthomonas bromi]